MNQQFITIKPGGREIRVNVRLISDIVRSAMLDVFMASGNKYSLDPAGQDARVQLAALGVEETAPAGQSPVTAPPAESKIPSLKNHLRQREQEKARSAPPENEWEKLSLDERAEKIVRQGWADRKDDFFKVCSPDQTGALIEYRVGRDAQGNVVCDCFAFQREVIKEPAFRCEHILAVKGFLLVEQRKIEAGGGDTPAADPAPTTTAKWRCHAKTRQRIEELMQKISEHPLRAPNTNIDSIAAQIRAHTGDKKAPENLLQEPAERVEKWLGNWLASLEEKATAAESAA